MGPYEVQQTRWDRIIRRVSGSIGPGSRVAETLSELFPVLDVERVPAELLILGGWRTGMGAQQLAATAAEVSKIQLFNPLGSGNLVVLTRVDFATTSIQTVEATITNVALADVVGGNIFRDTRAGLFTGGVAQIRAESSAASLAPTYLLRSPANDGSTLADDNGIAVLSPGTGFSIAPNVVNQFMIASFFWRERPAEESELQF